jgi:phage gp29-like protein
MKLFNRKLKPPTPTPTIPAWQLQAAQGGFPNPNRPELFAEMTKDSMIQTSLTIKTLGVLASGWKITGETEQAQFVREAFTRMQGSVHTILQNAMDAFAHGWSIQEIVYRADGGRWWIQGVRPKDPRYFTVEVDEFESTKSLRLNLPGETELSFSPDRFVIYRNRPGYGKPYGQSDLEAAIPHFREKKRLMEAWRVHLERFASPTLLAKFGKGATSEDQSAMLRSLEALTKNSAIVFPDEFDVRPLGERDGASQGFMDAIDFHNREITRAIVGQTLTTSEGTRVGSLAMGRVHLQVLLIQLEAIRRDLADTVMNEQVIKPLVALNFGDVEMPVFDFEPTALSMFATGQF